MTTKSIRAQAIEMLKHCASQLSTLATTIEVKTRATDNLTHDVLSTAEDVAQLAEDLRKHDARRHLQIELAYRSLAMNQHRINVTDKSDHAYATYVQCRAIAIDHLRALDADKTLGFEAFINALLSQ